MSAPSSSRNAPQGNASLHETQTIQRLQQRLRQQETEITNLGMSNASLRAENTSLETAISGLAIAIKKKNTELSDLTSQLVTSKARITVAETAARDFKRKYDDSLRTIEALKKASDAQSAKLERVETPNVNMKAYMGRTPSTPRNQHTIGGSPYPQQITRTESVSSSITGLLGASSLNDRRSASDTITSQQALPSFAVAPKSRQITIRHPKTAGSAPLIDHESASSEIISETKKLTALFGDLFTAIERFAKNSMIPLNEDQSQGIPMISALMQQGSGELIAPILSGLWSNNKLRHKLIMRYVSGDLVNNFWRLSTIASFSGHDSMIARLREITMQCSNQQTSPSIEKKLALVTERAKLVNHLNNQLAARNTWILDSTSTRAKKILEKLAPVLKHTPPPLKELTAIYIIAAKVFLYIWGTPYDWHLTFPTGGKSSYWNPAAHQVENEEIQGKTNAEIKAMDLKVVFGVTPTVTQVAYSGGATMPSCVCRARTLLSRDGVKLDY